MTGITEPGRYEISAEAYHADPVPGGSLSSSGARRLLPPGCPALFRHEQRNPAQPTADMVFGTAAHTKVLGSGPEIVTVEASDWRSKKAQQQRTEAQERGAIALLEDDVARIDGMAAAIRRNDIARTLLNPDYGQPEQAIFWQDPETDVWRRALVDWLPDLGSGRPIAVDYKTAASAERESIRRSVHKYGYHQQAAWYLDACHSIGYPASTAFVFLFQEKTPPYLITPVQLDDTAMAIGQAKNRQAIEVYRDCTTTDIWPGHTTGIESISLPAWAERRELEEIA